MISKLLFSRIDNSPLVAFRILFGILISLESFGADGHFRGIGIPVPPEHDRLYPALDGFLPDAKNRLQQPLLPVGAHFIDHVLLTGASGLQPGQQEIPGTAKG